MRKTIIIVLLIILSALALCQEPPVLRMATTTSTENSGLLAYLLPHFEKETGATVHVIAVGTGKALKLGENGDVDIVLVHSRPAEEKFVADGFGAYRRDVMYNDFLLAGPPGDPAGLADAANAPVAMQKLAAQQMKFVSRGDDSGTHKKEKQLWQSAGIEPASSWYVESGQGMGAVLLMASSMQAYTLTDRATYLKMKEKLELVPAFEGDPVLFNPYGVIPVNPKRHPQVAFALAEKFVNWIISSPIQQLIAAFGREEFGKSLFYPNAKPGQ
ncbi:MAG: substrate-binding domain-containing protein [Acidobacteria bacterium]|nr:substrate-binding domain-containing protein [Acidobacteriota bacterium]